MRIAISCFVWGDLGRPTRRARFSSALVDSGMSEKSIRETGIGASFLAARLACADEADRFLGISYPPDRVHEEQHAS